MSRFKKGDAVWLYWEDQATDYPHMYHRPGIVTKKVHPALFLVAFVESDPRRPCEEWKISRRSHKHHPTEMHPHDLDPGQELRTRRIKWADEAPKEKQAAWWKQEANRKRLNEEMNLALRPILNRMFA